jgi:hypothetical protein
MKWFRFSIAILAALILGASTAPAYETRPAILVHAGFGFPEENNLHGGWESGLGFVLPFAPRLAVAVEYLQWKDTSKQSFGKLYPGTLTLAPIQASLQYGFYENMYFRGYALAGAAYIVSRFRIGAYLSIPEVTIEQRVENGWAFFGGLGANLALSKTFDFYIEMSYMRRSLPAVTIVHDTNLGNSETSLTANLRHVFLKMGLKFYF